MMNCNRTTKYIILLFLFLTIDGISQSDIFEWEDVTCSYKSTLKKHLKLKEVNNAYKFIYSFDFNLKTKTVFKVSDINNLDLNDLNKQYTVKRQTILNLKLPKGESWEQLRNLKLKEVDESYLVAKIEYDIFLNNNFKGLDDFWASNECLNNYKTLLQGDEADLLEAWLLITKEKASKNGYPDEIWKKYNDNKVKSNWKELAKIDIVSFGWGNCANKFISRVSMNDFYNHFYNLFSETEEIDCYEEEY